MAHRSKGTMVAGPGDGPERSSASIDSAENGFIVHTTSEGGNSGYKQRTFVAPNHAAALRIASTHMQECALKGKSKGKKGKRGKSKIRTTKR